MRMIPREPRNYSVFIGKTVHTTNGKTGKVLKVWPLLDNVVQFLIETEGGDQYYTDNEHATIVRER